MSTMSNLLIVWAMKSISVSLFVFPKSFKFHEQTLIWEFAKNNNYCIVTFDFDFIDISTLKGYPPKIIWLRIGNTTTENLIAKIKADTKIIHDFLECSDTAFLEIK